MATSSFEENTDSLAFGLKILALKFGHLPELVEFYEGVLEQRLADDGDQVALHAIEERERQKLDTDGGLAKKELSRRRRERYINSIIDRNEDA